MKNGSVCCAQLALPLCNVLFEVLNNSIVTKKNYSDKNGQWSFSELNSNDIIYVSLPGFISKKYSYHSLPKKIRLLEKKLVAYQNKLWFTPREKISVFVNAPELYGVNVFRHGLEKEIILELGKHEIQKQSTPDDHFVESGLSWEESFSYTLPEDCLSGLYSVLLTSKNETFAIPFIVSSINHQQSKLLVLASTNTWQSYNIWGGRSRYRNNEDRKAEDFISQKRLVYIRLVEWVVKFIPNFIIEWIKKVFSYQPAQWKFKKLSIKRPYTNCLLEGDDVYYSGPRKLDNRLRYKS
ncbi:N,N-dimethylformamidase beta subunit family domain-containing protein [sulfur-oxidizing endosymbiont of Gigantopelta aegis]|uniref:N,N-dimethylformamidase beta subunit family domain-containing protein n=1 Tax=sulfur-oxidizing endosymbiont of Gigantopelta aegis TaxID=2794934 RepID=UPI0018DB76FD|nr:N,N-dimethylformamidase beta subunit family domain-containing protein [sulfur-oxidizing endosymbiont of Gigantopelta aegis]